MRALRRAARTAGRAAGKAADTAARTKKKKDSPELAERDRKAAVARTKERQRQENIRTTQRTSSINKSRSVSKADIMDADTAADFQAMQRRIDDLPDGNRKKMMQDILDRQMAKFKSKQSDELDAMTRKQQQSSRDRKEFKGYTPENPFEGMKKGGMAAKRKNYAKGGMANCGASMKPTQGSTKSVK